MENEKIEESYSVLQEFKRTGSELFQLILLMDDKLKKTPEIIIEPQLYPDLNLSGFLEESLVDLMVIRLSRLYKIQPLLGKTLVETGDEYRDLLEILSEVWNQIEGKKEKIELWRNSRVAHSEKQARDYKPIHIIDKDFKNTTEDIVLCSRLASWYHQVIYNNATDLFDNAQSIYERRYGKTDYVYFHEMWRNVENNEKKLIGEINERLKKSGFITIPPPDFSKVSGS